jgi:hemerythrin
MEAKSFPGLVAHRDEHADLVSTCVDIQKKFHANEAEVGPDTIAFLSEWLNHHIPVTDRSYAQALAN